MRVLKEVVLFGSDGGATGVLVLRLVLVMGLLGGGDWMETKFQMRMIILARLWLSTWCLCRSFDGVTK